MSLPTPGRIQSPELPVQAPVVAIDITSRLAPEVETSVFSFQPDARFWIGVTALGDTIRMGTERQAIGRLRANVYIDEYQFLPESARREDGTEGDSDDARSLHLAVIENQTSEDSLPRAVGTARLIKKRDSSEPLPVEEFFPEAFLIPAPVSSVEASRFISRQPNRLLQSMVSLSLIRAMVLEAETEGSPHIYAVVEDHLVRLFKKIGLPLEQIGDAKPIEEYKDTINIPLKFTPNEILRTAEADVTGSLKMSPFFRLPGPSRGLGFFDESLTRSPSEMNVE